MPPVGITVTNSLPQRAGFAYCAKLTTLTSCWKTNAPSQQYPLQTLTPLPQCFWAFTHSNGLDTSCQISHLQSHRYALEEGGTPNIAFSSTKSKIKRKRKRADSCYFCYASFWNHICESSRSHPAEKTDQFSLNHSPRFLWVGNCSLMLSFPHHPKTNFNCSPCFRSLCVGVGNGQGIRERKWMAWTHYKSSSVWKLKMGFVLQNH